MNSPREIEGLALDKMTNSSEAMLDRRRRILREARRIIGDSGLDMLNMRELGRRAGVSTKTIYNAFGSKEMVIALAIYTYFEKFVTHIAFEADARSFEGALTRQATSTLRDIDIPNFMKAVVALYFSPTIHPTIHAVLVDLATRSWTEWLKTVEDRRELLSGVVVRELLVDLSNVQYGRILEWSGGNTIEHDVFMRRSLSSVLMVLMGATSGKANREIQRVFTLVQTEAPYRQQLFEECRARIDAALSSLEMAKSRRTKPKSNALL